MKTQLTVFGGGTAMREIKVLVKHCTPVSVISERDLEGEMAALSAADIHRPEMMMASTPPGGPRRISRSVSMEKTFMVTIGSHQHTVVLGTLCGRGVPAVPVFLSRISAKAFYHPRFEWQGGHGRVWFVLAAPFRLVGEDARDIMDQLIEMGFPVADYEGFYNPAIVLSAGWREGWVVIDFSDDLPGEGAHLPADTSDHTSICRLALARISHLRQLLSVAILVGLQASLPNAPGWLSPFAVFDANFPKKLEPRFAVLVEGPLLIDRRVLNRIEEVVRKGGHLVGRDEMLRTILHNAVGIVQNQGLRLPDPDAVPSLQPEQRSEAYWVSRESDIDDFGFGAAFWKDLDIEYPEPHVNFYLRIKEHQKNRLKGLARVDLAPQALGRGSSLPGDVPLTAAEEEVLDEWAASLLNEWIHWDRPYPFVLEFVKEILTRRVPRTAVMAQMVKMERAN